MFIHQKACISPQSNDLNDNLDCHRAPVQNRLPAREPEYRQIPGNMLRRMGKAVRMGSGAALSLLQESSRLDGIIFGTANGGMEDCIKFLNQIVQYNEGRLTPTNFVQSTPNAIAAQIGLSVHNKGYNITHVHRGLAFENALADAYMLLQEHPERQYLLGGIDEISDYNYNIEWLDGAYKENPAEAADLYMSDSPGTLAGEGCAVFMVNRRQEGACCRVSRFEMLHSDSPGQVSATLRNLLDADPENRSGIDLLISGENGDNRYQPFYTAVESQLLPQTGIARYKHFCGEYPTASSMALWLGCRFMESGTVPDHFLKKKPEQTHFRRILLYNQYKGYQHSFLLIENR